MTIKVIDVPIDQFSDKELKGRNESEIKAFAHVLVAEGQVLYPVLAATLSGKNIILDGVKRLLACRYIVENELGDKFGYFKRIPTIQMGKLTPQERATITIATNEKRSDNEIAAYLSMKRLKEKGKWDQINKLWKFNPSRFKKLAKLDNLIEQQFFFDQFEEGNVATGTLFKVAAESEPRQKLCLAKLKDNEKLTGDDVREVRQAAAETVLGGLDLDLSEVTKAQDNAKYIYVNGKNVPSKIMSWQEAMAADEKGTLYRLVAVGNK